MVWSWTYWVLHKIRYSRGVSEPDPAAIQQIPLRSGQACCVLLLMQGPTLFKFSLNQESSPLFRNTLSLWTNGFLILLSQLSTGSSLCAALERLAGNKPHGTPVWQDQGCRDPRVPCWDPTPEPLQNHTELLQLQTPREGVKGKIKTGKMGEKARQRHREGQSYGKAWSGTARQVYDEDTAHVGSWC